MTRDDVKKVIADLWLEYALEALREFTFDCAINGARPLHLHKGKAAEWLRQIGMKPGEGSASEQALNTMEWLLDGFCSSVEPAARTVVKVRDYCLAAKREPGAAARKTGAAG